jgi:hypothetical protein
MAANPTLDEAVSRQVLHPDSCRFHWRQIGRILAQRFHGHNGLFAQRAVAGHRETRDGSNRLAHPAFVDALAHGIHNARSLIAKPGWKLRCFKIHAAIEHGLCPVQARCLNDQPDFALAGLLGGNLLQLQVFRSPELMKANDCWHKPSCWRWMNLSRRKVQFETGKSEHFGSAPKAPKC